MMIGRTDRVPVATTLGRKRIFVVVSRSVTDSETTRRHIVIYDNHPASLQLLFGRDLRLLRRNDVLYAALAIALVLAGGFGILWHLL